MFLFGILIHKIILSTIIDIKNHLVKLDFKMLNVSGYSLDLEVSHFHLLGTWQGGLLLELNTLREV